ncbi:MAG TPA: ORF6N domain-containing protein [Ferruginibacter sp.]|nr:ORF6N domain-containing protein [Ferruginibacter sp.]
MPANSKLPVITDESVLSKIYLIRGQKVMLDRDLAGLYHVETRILNQAVRRNIGRFPEDFMFQLTKEELENLKSQIVISSWGGRRYMPMAFTEQGVAMLSSVLNSPAAIAVNIQVIRVFTRMRALLLTNKDILLQLEKLEKKTGRHDEQIALVFEYLKKLLTSPQQPRRRIGFRRKDEED